MNLLNKCKALVELFSSCVHRNTVACDKGVFRGHKPQMLGTAALKLEIKAYALTLKAVWMSENG